MAMDQNCQPPEVSKDEREINSSVEDVAAILKKLQLSCSSEVNAASERIDQMISPEKRKLTATTPLKASQAISINVVDLSSGKYVLPDQQEPPYFVTLLHILGVKDDISAVADAYMRFDKQVLTSIHNNASIYLTRPEIGQVLQMHDSPEQKYEGSHEATEAADELVPVSLKDLKAGKLNECAVLYGELCVKPFKLGRIYTLLQEIGTGNAVALSIVSEDASSIDQHFARDNYPQGKKIAVKEPMLVRGEGGLLFINVNNPSSIETVESFPASNVAVNEENFEKWIDAMDEAYHSENWDKCMRNCTKGLLSSSKVMRINDFSIVRTYAERWRAQIETGRYEEAMLDAEAFCELRPSFSGGIKMKIRSLASLGRYQDLYRLLHSARANNAFGDEDNKEFTNICRTWAPRYCDIGVTGVDAPRPSLFRPDGDLIGPVEIRKTGNRNGRGLFATEDIKTGDCLLISKALAISHKAMDDPMKNGLFENVKNALNSCGDNILKLFISHASGKLVAKMGDFFNPSFEEKCCKATARVREDFEALQEKDSKIRQIIEGIAFDDATPAAIREKGKSFVNFNSDPIRLYYGVWLLPSFINHSCSPNAARINEGEIIRIHATRPIKEGQEITIPYFNVLLPYTFRHKLCNTFRFGCVCKCKRCEVERKIIGAESKAEALCESYSSACNAKIEERAAQLEKFVNRVENCLTVLRKRKLVGDKYGEDWFRSSFMAAYLGRITCRKKKAVKTSSDKDEEILLRAAHSIIETCPGDIQYLIFCHSCLSLWEDLAAKGLADEKYARQAYRMTAEAAISVYGTRKKFGRSDLNFT
ncbi:methyltransferase FGSG_00040 [Cryptomeria japonica]|uniref:methyltransferase FGSG_00040 n=1 Tax=Cryptomeria japonica TaxID=3369 RepID=UPI0027DA34F2|nr:methyltransferase FGSG_00040 [Cryptomeria japonica]XP_057844709.2 methyltransferase FGSG_00040 [Cryptomeria japonica]